MMFERSRVFMKTYSYHLKFNEFNFFKANDINRNFIDVARF